MDQSPSFSNFAGQLFGEAGFGALLPQGMQSGLTLMFRIKPQFKSWNPGVNPDRACFRINRNLYWNYKEKANLSFWKPYFHFRRFRVIPDPDLALVRIASAPIGRAVANQILSHRLWTWTFIFPIWSYYLSLKLGFGLVLGNGGCFTELSKIRNFQQALELGPDFSNLALQPFSETWLGACVGKLVIFYRAIGNQKFSYRLRTSAQTFPIWPWSLSLRLGLGPVLESLPLFTELSKIRNFYIGFGPLPKLFQSGPEACL